MDSINDIYELLMQLQLTKLQAKVYIGVTKSGAVTGRAAAKAANIAPADVYRVLLELIEKGLIYKLLAKPNMFKAVPLSDGISILVGQREEQINNVKKVIKEVVEREQASSNQQNNPSFIFLQSGKGAFGQIIPKVLQSASTSIDFIRNFRDSMYGHDTMSKVELDLMSKGVKIREIISVTKPSKASNVFLRLLKNPMFEVRFIDYPEPASIVIKDRTEAYVSTEINDAAIDLPHLCFSNRILVRITQEWYDDLWKKCGTEDNIAQYISALSVAS
jgi:sugar-specific transcriptional regulator TrmB